MHPDTASIIEQRSSSVQDEEQEHGTAADIHWVLAVPVATPLDWDTEPWNCNFDEDSNGYDRVEVEDNTSTLHLLCTLLKEFCMCSIRGSGVLDVYRTVNGLHGMAGWGVADGKEGLDDGVQSRRTRMDGYETSDTLSNTTTTVTSSTLSVCTPEKVSTSLRKYWYAAGYESCGGAWDTPSIRCWTSCASRRQKRSFRRPIVQCSACTKPLQGQPSPALESSRILGLAPGEDMPHHSNPKATTALPNHTGLHLPLPSGAKRLSRVDQLKGSAYGSPSRTAPGRTLPSTTPSDFVLITLQVWFHGPFGLHVPAIGNVVPEALATHTRRCSSHPLQGSPCFSTLPLQPNHTRMSPATPLPAPRAHTQAHSIPPGCFPALLRHGHPDA
ncbi:hypothetical protein NMY22_g11885 [Coprinellus aureogranulatus]|nr:hypothetical protein NMY22_g11885 [Coprinellus aureogranulatus]